MSTKLLSLHRPARASKNLEYLGPSYFAVTLGGALLLHVAALYIWNIVPHASVEDIPVRVLNIKLGDDGPSPDLQVDKPSTENKNNVESAISQLIEPPKVEVPVTVSDQGATTATQAMDKIIADKSILPADPHSSKQLVRPNAVQAKNAIGNSTAKEAELMSRYEQLISLWIEKFKLYPEEARTSNMQGDTIIRIRIDRQGNILYYILERSTGYPLLDHAVIDMIKRANPVPAVPTDYPKGDLIEFLIPVNFHLQ